MNDITKIDFFINTHLYSGPNEFLRLRDHLAKFSLHKIGVIVDPAISNHVHFLKGIGIINESPDTNVKQWIYDIQGEPTYEALDRVKRDFIDKNGKPLVDCFVGIGGGSCIDMAKGLAVLMTNPGPAIQYRGFPENIHDPLPVIAVPTTAGTGSDATYNAVFIDTQEKFKLGINTTKNFPLFAILDPLFIVESPLSVIASSGMDAMVHTLESYATTGSNQITRMFSREAFRLLFNNLWKYPDNPDDVHICQQLQLGAYLAGIALFNSGGGPAGSLSYPLGVHFHVPHGLASAVFLPYIIQHNVEKGYDYSELYDLIEGTDSQILPREKNIEFRKKIFALCSILKIPDSLTKFSVTQDNIGVLLDAAENLKGFSLNPVLFTVEDGKNLLRKLVKEEI